MERKTFLKLLVSAAMVIGLFYLADPDVIASNILEAELSLYVLAAAFFLTTFGAAAYRWKNLSRSIGYSLSLSESFRVIAVAYGFNKLFPGNSGDLLRSKIFERYTRIENHGSILGIVILERFLDLFALLSVLLVSLLFVTSDMLSTLYWVVAPFTVIILVLMFLLFVDESWLLRILEHLPRRLEEEAEALAEGYQSLSRGELLHNFVPSYYRWLAEVLVFYLLALSLDVSLTIPEAAMITGAMSLISSLPISPAGIGPVDATGIGLLVLTGVDYSTAFSVIVLKRSIGVVLTGLQGALVYWFEELYY